MLHTAAMYQDSRIEHLLRSGGRERVHLLQYAVRSVTMELLVHFLVGEYRFHPRPHASLAIYDVFCAPDSVARIKAAEIVPARTLRLSGKIVALRRALADFETGAPAMSATPEDDAVPLPPPPPVDRGLFDDLVRDMWADPDGALVRVERDYDPAISPQQNLPGGRMSPAQRHFVENVWKPRVRPILVGVGFWQLSSID